MKLVQAEHVPSGPATPLRVKCRSCEMRRVCHSCISCEGYVCAECSRKTKEPYPEEKTFQRVCDDCYDEAKDYARYGPWGPP